MKPGILKDLPMSDYVADRVGDLPTASAGALHTLLTRSSAHCFTEHPRLGGAGPDNSERADIGSAAHEVLIGGENRIVAVPFDDYRKNEAKSIRTQAWSECKIPVLAPKLPAVLRMIEVARGFIFHSEISDMLPADSELTLVWQDGKSWCRARPDWLTLDRKWHISYKTTAGSANPESWIRNHLIADGHDLAAAHYERGINALCKTAPQTVFLVQEQAEPFACSLVGLDPGSRDLAARKHERALMLWENCMATGKWPAYPTDIHYAAPLPWDINRLEEQELAGRYFTEKELEGGIPL